MKSWQLVRHFLFFQIKVMKMDGGVLADITDTEPAHSAADRMEHANPEPCKLKIFYVGLMHETRQKLN